MERNGFSPVQEEDTADSELTPSHEHIKSTAMYGTIFSEKYLS